MPYILSETLSRYYLACGEKKHSNKTMQAYQDTLLDFLTFVGDIPVNTLTSEHIQNYLDQLKKRPGPNGYFSQHSIHKYYSNLRTFTRWMYLQGYIEKQIIQANDLPQPKLELPDVLTADEVDKLLDFLHKECKFRDLVLFETMLDTGLRVQELTKVDLEDVDLEQRIFKIKAEQNAIVPFGKTLERDLSTYIQHHRISEPTEHALFVNRFGTRLEPEGLNMLIKRTLHQIRSRGKCGAETLRSTYAVSFLRNGGKVEVLHKILRNKDFRTTERYMHLARDIETS